MPVVTLHSCTQVAAFKDYEPGSGGGGGGAPAQAAASQEPEEAQDEEEPEEESAGPSGDFPPHTVMGLPALSPTMSQGARFPYRATALMLSLHWPSHLAVEEVP